MQKIIDFLIVTTSVSAILIALLLLFVFIYYSTMKKNAQRLLSGSERTPDFIYKLLRAAFPQSRIIKHASLPLPTGQMALSDIILVDRGGVFVIRVKSFPGAIDNTNRSVWTVSNNKGIGEFPNPFEQNRFSVNAIEHILKAEKIHNVPKHNIVVFSQKRVAFKINYEKLLTAERLIEAIKDINRNRFLTQKEINATLMAIRKYMPRQR